ncbi:hypothetical protein ACP3P8_21760 [Pseudomonas aeruginosa]
MRGACAPASPGAATLVFSRGTAHDRQGEAADGGMGSGLRIFFVRQRNGGKIATKASSRAGNRGATLVIPGETDRLASLYARARGEGGKVVLWAGGDAPNQMDWLKTAFESRFPA